MGSNAKTYCLYVHTTPNGKKYVGITSKSPTERWLNGRGYRGSFFSNAVRKYGWDNIKHEVLFEGLSEEDAIRLECEYIEKYGTTDRSKGYNRSLGGEVPANNMADIEEYRLQQSIKSHSAWERGINAVHHNYAPPRGNKSHYRKKVFQYDADGNLITVHDSVRACADALGVTVMPVSDACNKRSKCKGFILRFENDDCLSDGVRGSWGSKRVIQMDISGNVIAEYPSASSASKSFGRTSPCTILDACKGKQITAYGYRWKFA